jgi:hypothetical protein
MIDAPPLALPRMQFDIQQGSSLMYRTPAFGPDAKKIEQRQADEMTVRSFLGILPPPREVVESDEDYATPPARRIPIRVRIKAITKSVALPWHEQ